jgi:serine protease Do
VRNSLIVFLGLIAAPLAIASNPFQQAAVQRAFQNVAPSLCHVTYAYEITNPNTGRTQRNNSSALGVIVSPDGLVMVRGHMVIENIRPFNARVSIGEGEAQREYNAEILEKPDDVNVAFVRIQSDEPLDLPALRFDESTPQIGQNYMIFGILGDSLDNARAVHTRFISAVLDEPRPYFAFDTPLPLGFVGGPVVSGEGRVVGVLGYDLSPQEGGELFIRSGHPLFYTSDLFTEFFASPPGEGDEDDTTDDAWLGVFTQPLTDDLATYWDLPKQGGIVVSTLVPGSPGAEAGLQRGDIITSFNDTPLRAKQDREVLGFTKLVRDTGAGETVEMRVFRNGEPLTLSVTLGSRPKSAQEATEYEDTVFGITVRELTTDVRIRLNVPEDANGVLVWRVKSGSWADLAEIRPGFIIMNFGDHPIANVDDFKEAVQKVAEEKPTEVSVFCRVAQVTAFYRIEPRWSGNESGE